MSSIPRALRLLSSGVAAITVVGAGLVASSGGAGAAPVARSAAVTAPALPAVLPAVLPSNVQRISGATRFDTAIATS